LNVYNAGYQNRANKLIHDMTQMHSQIRQATHELESFKMLRELELEAIPKRMEMVKQEVDVLGEQETELQMWYSRLAIEKDDLLASFVSKYN